MSNPRCVQLSGGVVVGDAWLARRFRHPALVWVEDHAPALFGHHYTPETREFLAPNPDGSASDTVTYTAPEQP